MADVEFKDYTIEVKEALAEIAYATMEEVGGELESKVKRNQDRYRDTGATTNSWTHRVSGSMMAGEYRVTIGSPMENAIWEEFGTGEYALNGDGRKGGWVYVDEEGHGHFTYGKEPRRHFWNAYTTSKNRLIRHIQNRFKGRLS